MAQDKREEDRAPWKETNVDAGFLLQVVVGIGTGFVAFAALLSWVNGRIDHATDPLESRVERSEEQIEENEEQIRQMQLKMAEESRND